MSSGKPPARPELEDDRQPGPQPFSRWLSLLLLLGVTALLFTVSLVIGDPGRRQTIRYDELIELVRDGRVRWVHITADEIQGEARSSGSDGIEAFVTGRLDDDRLVPLLESHDVAFRGVPDSAWGTEWVWFLYLGLMIGLVVIMFRRARGGGPRGMLAFGKSRGKVFREHDVTVTFQDVAGVDEAKAELSEIIEFLQTPQKYELIGARIPKGVLLVGPPGTGKTLLARAVAGEAGVPFISINGSEFVEMFVGVGAARVRDLFDQAAQSAPCIVFIDELDAIGRSRGGAALGPGSNEEREQTLNQLLAEMDGFQPTKAVVIMSATNRPEVLDPALLRPGRFDRQVLVDRPDRVGREQILRVHVRGVKIAADVDLSVVASRTPGFAGADLAALVNEAALLAARAGEASVGMAAFSDAIDRVVAGLEKKSRLITDEEKRRIAFHESGHALAGCLAGTGEKIHKISIVPRGLAALGYTMQLPTEERYLMTESAIVAKLVGLLGGRAAEELVFGEASTGALDDLRRATEIARAMVMEYGMSDEVGVVSVSREPRPLFLGPAFGGVSVRAEAGDRLGDTIDAEVRRIVEGARIEALRLLSENRRALETLAERLIEAEQLEGEELDELLGAARATHRLRTGSAA